MAIYFCDDCQQFKDNDWVLMSERGLCEECEAKREEAMREFVAEQVGRVLREAENREQGL